MADGNVPSSVPLDSFLPPSSKGTASPSSNANDEQKKAQKRAEAVCADVQQFQLFEAAILGVEADARRKGGLTKFDIAIIRGLQRDMLAIGKRFIQRGKQSLEAKTTLTPKKEKTKETNVLNWQRITKDLESTLALKTSFDEDAPQYQNAAKNYKNSLLYSVKKELVRGKERFLRQVEVSGADAVETRLEQLLVKRGQGFVSRPAYEVRLADTEAELPPPEPPTSSVLAAKLGEAAKNAEAAAAISSTSPSETTPEPSTPKNESPEPSVEEPKTTAPTERATKQAEPDQETPAEKDRAANPRLEQPLPETEPPIASATAATLGTPLATSVLGAVAAKRNEAPSEESNQTSEEPSRPTASSKIEQALKELDQQEEALIQRSDKVQERKKGEKLSVATFEELTAIAREQQALHKKRLELYTENGNTFPGQYNSLYDQKSLESAVRYSEGAIEQQELATLRRRYWDALSDADRKTLDGIIFSINSARLESHDEKNLHEAAQVGAQKLVQRALERLATFQEAHPLPTSAQSQGSIADVRTELRQEFAVKKEQSLILESYEERMREYAWETLQARDQVKYAQMQSLQAANPSVLLDVTVLLQPDDQELIQLKALTDVRKAFPDTSDELISTLLVAKAEAAKNALELATTQSALAALGVATLGSIATKAAAVSMIAPMIGGLLRDANRTADALRNEEAQIATRAKQIRQLLDTPPQAGQEAAHAQQLSSLQREQQQSLGSRRKLQAGLHAQTASLENLQDASGIKNGHQEAIDPSSPRTEHAGLFASMIAARGIQPLDTAASPGLAASRTSMPGTRNAQPSAQVSSPSLADEAEANTNAAEHSAQIASRLASNQLRDRRLAEMNQASSNDASSSSSGVSDGAPLLALPVAAKTAAQRFTQEQQAMMARRDDFSGTGQKPSGYEAMFGEGAPDGTEDGDTSELGYTESTRDAAEQADMEDEAAENEDAEIEQQELLRRAQFLELQQESANEQAAAAQQRRSPNASQIKKLADSPAGKKLVQSAGKLLANPATILILLVVLFIWLNLRLLLPKEGSILRKPMTPLEKVGTVAFDIFFIFFLLVSLIITVITVIVPFLPFLLPVAAGLGILQAALHLFS